MTSLFASQTAARDICFDIFKESSGAFNYAVEKSLNTEGKDILSGTIIRVIPQNVLEHLSPDLFQQIFRQRPNSQSYAWSHSKRDDRSAAALAHVVSCSAEKNFKKDETRRTSICSARMKVKLKGASDNVSTLVLPLGSKDGENRSDREGSMGCWCDRRCHTEGQVIADGAVSLNSRSSRRRIQRI